MSESSAQRFDVSQEQPTEEGLELHLTHIGGMHYIFHLIDVDHFQVFDEKRIEIHDEGIRGTLFTFVLREYYKYDVDQLRSIMQALSLHYSWLETINAIDLELEDFLSDNFENGLLREGNEPKDIYGAMIAAIKLITARLEQKFTAATSGSDT